MKIGIDAGCLGIDDKRLKVGVYRFAKEFLSSLSEIDNKNSYILYSFKEISQDIMESFGKNFSNTVVRPSLGWMKVWLPLKIKQDDIDLFIAVSQAVPERLPKKTITLGVIHDISFEDYPMFHKNTHKKMRENTKKLIQSSNLIITFSNYVNNDVQKKFNIQGAKIVTLYEGVRKRGARKRTNQHFLYIGALKVSKNVPNIIRAYDIFQQQHNSDKDLVIIGGDMWLDDEIEIAMQEIAVSTKKKIKFTGHVSDKKLREYYTDALAFVSPSFAEGFGLTHAEAMSAGVPVIGSDKGSLPEIVGDAGILVDPTSPDEIAKAMSDIYKDKRLRKKLADLGKKRAQRYSWEKFARSVYDIIQSYEKA